MSHRLRPASEEPVTHPGRSIAWILWFALLVGLAVVGIWLALSLQRVRSSYPGLSSNIPLASDKSYGVNADLSLHSPEALDRTLSQMRQLGLRWIRHPFFWSEIETASGQFNWGALDRVVEAVNAQGMQLIAVLDTTPAWARPLDTSPFTPPDELSDFGAFARAVAERYGDHLDHYQIWDEPNLSAHWGDRFVDPPAYARLLREGAVNVRAADPDAVVLTAALAPTLENGPLNLNEPEFLAELYAANAAPWFDAVAAQPYGFDQEPTASSSENDLSFARIELLRQQMIVHGDNSKAIWVTAFGWSSLPQPWGGQPSPWPTHSPETQAAYTVQAIQHGRDNWPWMGPMFLAVWDAKVLSADDPRRGLALIAGDTILPQTQAIQHQMLDDGAAPVAEGEIASVGVYPAQHRSGQYNGNWRFSSAGADVPRDPLAALTVVFQGTRLDLLVRRGAYRGFLYVTIDGQPANSLPTQTGRAYVVLYDPLEREDVVTLARHLPDGPHTAVIEAEGGWYQWPIVGWRVSREGDARTIWVGLTLVGGLAMVAAAGLARSMRHLTARDVERALTWGQAVNKRYMALGTPAHLAVMAAIALAFYFSPGTLTSLGLLGILLFVFLPRPDLGLALTAFSLPFFLLPKSLVGRTISMTEVSLVTVALAHVIRRTLTLSNESVRQVTNQQSRTGAHWLDWTAWLLTGIAILAGALTLIPAASTGSLAAFDWPILTLLLVPLAGVLAAVAQATPRADQFPKMGLFDLDLGVIALVALALAATLAAESFGVSLQEFHVVVWDGAAFYFLVRLTRGLDAGPKAARSDAESLSWTIVDALLLGTTLMALYAVYQFFFTDRAITAEGVHRALGVYGSPNNLGLLLDRVAPILIAVVVLAGQGRGGERDTARGFTLGRRELYGLALISTLVAIVLTFSRGALLLGLPVAILFIGISRRGRILRVTLAALALAGGGLVPLFGTPRFRSILDTSAGTGFFRLRLWQSAWAMFRDHPWLGVGLDNFLYQYRTRYILPDAWQEPNLSHPHNILLDFGTRLGIGGIAVLLWVQLAFWRNAARLYHCQPEGEGRALTLGLMASMAAILAHGMVDNSFFLVDLAFIFFLLLALVRKMEAW